MTRCGRYLLHRCKGGVYIRDTYTGEGGVFSAFEAKVHPLDMLTEEDEGRVGEFWEEWF